jgi:hypothetical protein
LKKHPVYTERSAEIFKKTRGLKTFEELWKQEEIKRQTIVSEHILFPQIFHVFSKCGNTKYPKIEPINTSCLIVQRLIKINRNLKIDLKMKREKGGLSTVAKSNDHEYNLPTTQHTFSYTYTHRGKRCCTTTRCTIIRSNPVRLDICKAIQG